jgi:hypothetical protein
MPAKFKESERIFPRGARGQRMNTHSPVKKWQHFYLKQTPVVELLKAINGDYTKPKVKIKCRNEIARRGLELVWLPKSQ